MWQNRALKHKFGYSCSFSQPSFKQLLAMTSSCICKCHLDLCHTRTFWGFKQHLKSVSLKCLSKEETLKSKTDGLKWKEKIAVFSWHWKGFFLERCKSETSAFLSCLRTNVQVQCGVKSAANTSLHRKVIRICIYYVYLYCSLHMSYENTRVWARLRHCANPALQLKLSLKKTAKGTICPLQNLGKKMERKHAQRDLVQYKNCKLKQNVESIFYHTFKVHSKVTFQACSTEQLHLMLNQAWWTHLAIFNMSHRKRIRTLQSFFTPNRSQSESEKNGTDEEQCINQEETWLRDHTWLRCEKEAMFCY